MLQRHRGSSGSGRQRGHLHAVTQRHRRAFLQRREQHHAQPSVLDDLTETLYLLFIGTQARQPELAPLGDVNLLDRRGMRLQLRPQAEVAEGLHRASRQSRVAGIETSGVRQGLI